MSFLDVAPHWLCPPGEGVYTVHTGSEKRLKLQKALYGDVPAREAWLASLAKLASEQVAIFGIASDCGGGIQRGANWGPLFIREALLQDGTPFADIGDAHNPAVNNSQDIRRLCLSGGCPQGQVLPVGLVYDFE